MLQRTPMSTRAYSPRNTLMIDASKIRHCQPHLIQLLPNLEQPYPALHNNNTFLLIYGQNLVEFVQVDEPGGCAGYVRGRVSAPDGGYAASASSCEVHEFLDLGDGLGLDVKFGGGVKGSCPS